MPTNPRTRALPLALAGLLLATACGHPSGTPARHRPPPPPRHTGFDYQIGGAYPPPAGARTVVRDRTAHPARGHYSVCYVNAFQAQPGERGSWPRALLLRDAGGRPVVDRDWDEQLLAIGTDRGRRRIAARVGRWIDGCARRGFQAVEPDNYDSYTRSGGLLTRADAVAYLTLLTRRAHARGLAVAQKNTAALAPRRARVGLDFAVVEECGAYDECGVYDRAFDGRVLDVEYTDAGLRAACAHGGRIAVVRRDRDVRTPGERGYVRRTC